MDFRAGPPRLRGAQVKRSYWTIGGVLVAVVIVVLFVPGVAEFISRMVLYLLARLAG